MTREEAIKIVRNIYQTDKEKEALETLIPELKESEDERIRKGLIEALKTSKTVGELKFILPEPTREECISYLEKQKEQKPEERFKEAREKYQVEWSEEDESFLDSIEKAIHSYYDLNHAPQYDYWLEEKLKSIRPSWKPSNEQIGALYDCIEWEEERAEDVDFILKSLYNGLKKLCNQ